MNPAGGFVVGVDLGGTNLRVGAVSPAGEVLALRHGPLPGNGDASLSLESIGAQIGELCAAVPAGHLEGIGVASTGPLDRTRGTIENPYTLPGWQSVPIVSFLTQRLHVPVVLENDADAAALGEAWAGLGRDRERVVAVTVGTGIGLGFVLHGQVYRGMGGLHPEAGHQVIDPSGPACYCGAHGCWESLASGPILAERARTRARNDEGMLAARLARGLPVEPEDVAAAARGGDGLALELMAEEARYLGLGLVNVLAFYLPDVVTLSGGLMGAWDLLEGGIRAVVAQHSVMAPSGDVLLARSELGIAAGVLGAARATWNHLESGDLV
jgi:glucokinase